MENFAFVPRALASALFDIAFALATGLVVARALSAHQAQISRHTLTACSSAIMVSLTIQAWLTTVTMNGSYAWSAVRSDFVEVMTGTHAGRATVMELLVCITLLACSLLRINAKLSTFCTGLLLALLAATRSASGHAAVNGDFSATEAMQFVHLISIAIWSGAVMAAGLFLLPKLQRRRDSATIVCFTRGLSSVVTWALLFVVATGAYKAYAQLGALSPLTHTQWGLLLTVKIALVMIAISIGGYNRMALRGTFEAAQTRAFSIAAAVRLEGVVMLIILTISAFLANSPTP